MIKIKNQLNRIPVNHFKSVEEKKQSIPLKATLFIFQGQKIMDRKKDKTV